MNNKSFDDLDNVLVDVCRELQPVVRKDLYADLRVQEAFAKVLDPGKCWSELMTRRLQALRRIGRLYLQVPMDLWWAMTVD